DSQCTRPQSHPYAEQYTGDEAPLDDYQRDTRERYVFDEREIPPRIEHPSIKQVQAAVEQQTAQDELRYVSEKAGAGREYETRDGRDRKSRKRPREPAKLVEVPGKRERNRGRGLEQPAGRLCVCYGDAGPQATETCRS